MSAVPSDRTRVTILGGFLGAGKTTWLRHQLHHGQMADALVVVNEAAAAPVDGAILSRRERVVTLPGGCACCEGRASLVALLRGLANDRTREAGEAPRHVVLETSGLADPAGIVEAIRSDPVLIHHVLVAETVVVVDGVNGLSQLRDEPLSRAQVEAADRLVVTKVDQAEAEELHLLVSVLAGMNPDARRYGTVMGSAAELVQPDPDLARRHGPGAADVRLLVAAALDLGPEPDWTRLTVWLSALLHARGHEIVRVKGVVRTPAGRLLLQGVRRSVQPPEILPDVDGPSPHDNMIAVIGRGFTAEALPRSFHRFTAEPGQRSLLPSATWQPEINA